MRLDFFARNGAMPRTEARLIGLLAVTVSTMFIALCTPPSVMADTQSNDRASFTSMSSGSSRSSTPEFERAIEEALVAAKEANDAVFTVERLFQRLLEEPEVVTALSEADVDIDVLASELDAYLTGLRKTDAGFTTITDPKLRGVLQSTHVLWHVAGVRRVLSSMDVLAAIVRQGDSFAADLLIAYGLSAQQAADLADAYHIETGRQRELELQETQEKLAALANTQAQTLKFSTGTTSTAVATPMISVAEYRLTVVSRDPVDDVQFKGAISADGSLNLLIETTPFETTFLGSEVIALFESASGDGGISVTLFAIQSDGTEKNVGGFGGQSGVILESARDLDNLRRSGYLR